MRLIRNIACLTCACLVTLAAMQATADDELEIHVGRTAAQELAIEIHFPQPVVVPVSIFPGITGYAFGELAFHSLAFDEPTNDFFQLSPSADFRLILIAKDPGMEVWNDTGSGFLATNQTYYIGQPPFDNHPLWNIVNGTQGSVYSLTLKLYDVNNVYPDSNPFVLSFTPEQKIPHININRVGAQHAALLWTTNSIGWELQSSPSLTSTNWNTITNAPSVVATNFSLTINTDAQQQFFRLHRP
jgi:hypothetical protein